MYPLGDNRPPAIIPNREIPICPTAFYSEESIAIIEEFEDIRTAKEATGSPYFPSISAADARFVHALIILEQERTYTEAEIKAAINRS